MIYLAYASYTEIDGNVIPVNGHRSRIDAISQCLDNYTILSLDAPKPEYVDGDIIIVDAGDRSYGHLLDATVFSVLISDDYGFQYEGTGTDIVVYVSGNAASLTWECEMLVDMFYTVGGDVIENCWIGGDNVVFIPGSNRDGFWKHAEKYVDYCKENQIGRLVVDGVGHGQLMNIMQHARCVITAAGVTAKEAIYQGVPTILVKTADNQGSNYSYFVGNLLAMPQNINPDILLDTYALHEINQRIKTREKLNVQDMVNKIKEAYHEIYS